MKISRMTLYLSRDQKGPLTTVLIHRVVVNFDLCLRCCVLEGRGDEGGDERERRIPSVHPHGA